MQQNFEEIESTALALSREDRVRLAERLMDSLDDESIEAAWRTEVRRRVEEIRNGTVETIDGYEVMRDLRERHR